MDETKESLKEVKKFSFWRMFLYIFFAILSLLLIFFGFIGSYKEDFFEALMGTALFSLILAIPFTFFIKWWKEYRLTGRLIIKEAGEKDRNGKPQTRKNKLAVTGFVLGIAFILLVGGFFIWQNHQKTERKYQACLAKCKASPFAIVKYEGLIPIYSLQYLACEAECREKYGK